MRLGKVKLSKTVVLSKTVSKRDGWLIEEEQILLELKAASKSWPEIIDELDRSESSVRNRFAILVDYGARLNFLDHGEGQRLAELAKQAADERKTTWTNDEDIHLLELKIEGKTWSEIGQKMPGRNYEACSTHYQKLKIICKIDSDKELLQFLRSST